MRKFDGVAAVEDIPGGGKRVRLTNSTGEGVFHDLSAEEVAAFREAIGKAVEPKPAARPAPARAAPRRRAVKKKR